ncbi:hypothetical protein AMK33_26420 [Streptomyces sp. CB02400]|nr:hypothetical protein AMK33_26420 [Streptomyces sp. CB02400]
MTFRTRQSSSVLEIGAYCEGTCGHNGPGSVASRTPIHGRTGRGGAHRYLPSGAPAYGMPRKIRYGPDRVPRTRPASVRAVSPAAAPAGSARRTSAGAGPERTVQASGADTSTVSTRAEAVTVTASR